jgi:ABC-2 type transport system permease protein
MKLGAARALAYRVELVIWMLSSTLPLLLLPLWFAVAATAPIAGFRTSHFTAYFLAGFVVRQLVGGWASWTINEEVRTGTLSLRLLMPIHPAWAYATESLASVPLRGLLAVPVAAIALVFAPTSHVSTDPATWMMVPFALIGAWAIELLSHLAIGALSLWLQQSVRVFDVWSTGFFLFSGYLVPVSLFPAWLRPVIDWLPFRSVHGFPVELITGGLDPERAARMLGAQWCWVALVALLAAVAWKRGLRHYAAYGG